MLSAEIVNPLCGGEGSQTAGGPNRLFLSGNYLKGEFEVLASPNVKSVVVGAQFFEEGLVDGEQSAGHRRTVHRIRRMGAALFLVIRNSVPVELFPGAYKNFSFISGRKNGPTFFLSPTQANISCGAIKLPAGSEVRLVEFVGKFYGTGKVSEIK